MKAILVIDIKEDSDIKTLRANYEVYGDIRIKPCYQSNYHVGEEIKLKPMPQRIEQGYPTDDYTIGKADGWNACIEEILK